jgi:hypothetical protein
MDRYLESRWWRKYCWAGISLCTGYYAGWPAGWPILPHRTAPLIIAVLNSNFALLAGNIVTLSFGALAVNDVLAAAITLTFCEAVTHCYYTANEPSLSLWFANCFKLGLIASLLADAAKLGS